MFFVVVFLHFIYSKQEAKLCNYLVYFLYVKPYAQFFSRYLWFQLSIFSTISQQNINWLCNWMVDWFWDYALMCLTNLSKLVWKWQINVCFDKIIHDLWLNAEAISYVGILFSWDLICYMSYHFLYEYGISLTFIRNYHYFHWFIQSIVHFHFEFCSFHTRVCLLTFSLLIEQSFALFNCLYFVVLLHILNLRFFFLYISFSFCECENI